MKITKVYCDICKEEKDDLYYLKLLYNRQGYATDNNIQLQDVCEGCAKKIVEFVRGLQNDKV